MDIEKELFGVKNNEYFITNKLFLMMLPLIIYIFIFSLLWKCAIWITER